MNRPRRIFAALLTLATALSLGCSDADSGGSAGTAAGGGDSSSDGDALDGGAADAASDAATDGGKGGGADAADAASDDATAGDAAASDAASADAASTDAITADAAATDATADAGCVPASPPIEACNGQDDDCDGQTDEGAELCDDDNVCTVGDACVSSGEGFACKSTPITGPCDDGDVCTGGETCATGSCEGGFVSACNDQNDCTFDSCDSSGKGCTHEPVPGCGIDCNLDKPACPKPLYCAATLPLTCGGAGRCEVVPAKCDGGGGAVCGCDGKTYASACEAAMAQVNVQSSGSCAP